MYQDDDHRHQSSNDDDNKGMMPYGFEYDVNDGHENNFGHWQQSDGQVTTGSYRVQLPDGRTQIVTYRADENGYNAQVTYDEPTAISRPLDSYRRTTTTTPAAAPRPFYEFPGIPPYHGPSHGAYQRQSTSSSNPYGSVGTTDDASVIRSTTSGAAAPYSSDDGSEDSDESITENPIPLLFRRIGSSKLYGDVSRIPLGYSSRSTSLNGKRSPPPPSSIWSEQRQPLGAVNISKALDTRGDDESDQFHDENDKQVESQQIESSSTHFENGDGGVDFDHLPFPLPLPLAFRPV